MNYIKMFIKGLCVKYSLEIKFLITFAVYLFLSPLVVFIGYLFVLSSHGLVIGVFNQYDFFLLDEYQFLYYLYSVVTILASVVVYVVLLNSLVKYKAGAKELIEFKTKTIEWFRDVTKHGNQ